LKRKKGIKVEVNLKGLRIAHKGEPVIPQVVYDEIFEGVKNMKLIPTGELRRRLLARFPTPKKDDRVKVIFT